MNTEILSRLVAILPCEQMLITGSEALRIYGLCDSAKDLDLIVVNPTEEARTMAFSLQKAHPVSTCAYPLDAAYRFNFEGTNVDLFVENTPVVGCASFNGVSLNPVRRIVSAKKQMGRSKDIKQLRKIASRIITNAEIISWLDK